MGGDCTVERLQSSGRQYMEGGDVHIYIYIRRTCSLGAEGAWISGRECTTISMRGTCTVRRRELHVHVLLITVHRKEDDIQWEGIRGNEE